MVARALDDDGVAGRDACDAGPVERVGEGLEEGELLGGHGVRRRYEVCAGENRHVLAEAAPEAGAVVRAEGVAVDFEPLAAGAGGAAEAARSAAEHFVHGDAVALAYGPVAGGVDALHPADGLVAGNDGEDGVADEAMAVKLGGVAAAEAHGLDAEHEPALRRVGLGEPPHFVPSVAGEDYRAYVLLHQGSPAFSVLSAALDAGAAALSLSVLQRGRERKGAGFDGLWRAAGRPPPASDAPGARAFFQFPQRGNG